MGYDCNEVGEFCDCMVCYVGEIILYEGWYVIIECCWFRF